MKNGVKILLFVISAIIIINFIISDQKNNIIIDKKEQCIATIYYSYMIGIDAGTEYVISFYKSTNNSYKYVINKSDITIEGSINKKEYKKGIIKSKEDLINLNKQFINKQENGVKLYNSFYKHINQPNKLLDIEELANELF